MDNYMELKVNAVIENEAFVRNTVAAFAASCDPSIEVLGDIKTAVSEAISNCIVHAYKNRGGEIVVKATLSDRPPTVRMVVTPLKSSVFANEQTSLYAIARVRRELIIFLTSFALSRCFFCGLPLPAR